ncbi:hypothetical protein H5410_042563 [Solanum commersonii]|uniref:PROP1-like PPR domain-containing protein n=1 Tax=Solanum commersonii TaxID=4109 RepID=A0A9J5XV30_SOLCO|nr:hypothetical protein H5410_042563 [Solanum commersonii]
MNEFLSRFVLVMRGKLMEVYPDFEKNTIHEMLLVIVGKGGFDQQIAPGSSSASSDFSEDLWKTVWEEVKEMCRFAGEVGICGEMLREYRFRWAREKMEETEFYQNEEGSEQDSGAEEPKVVALPKRRAKINYKIYGLDLSDSKWSQVADKIHEAEKIIWPQEPKRIDGKCKIITDKILSSQEKDYSFTLIAEWVQLLQPSRVDWINLLDRLKKQNASLYLKVFRDFSSLSVFELLLPFNFEMIAVNVLGEESFKTNIRDYSKLIDAHARDNRLEDAKRIIKKMSKHEIVLDILTSTTMVHIYSKAGDLDRANAAFESLRTQGFLPDMGVYNSMILAYVNAGDPKKGESLMREMEARDIKPSKEIFMALLRSFV